MLFGCCAKIDQAAEVNAAGFDYIEAAVTSLIPDEKDEAFAPILAQYKASPVPTKAMNILLPRDLKIVGPEVNYVRIKNYVKRAVSRIQQVGASRVVVGSGGARNIPRGFSRNRAVEQIVHFFDILGKETEETEIILTIEPLNTKESNIINSLTEGFSIVERVNRPSVRLLADFYHMDEEKEPLENIIKYSKCLKHVHVADTGRKPPGTGCYPYGKFVDNLYKAKYDGMVSIECNWEDFESEAPPSIQSLKNIFGKYY